jgi:hypothetical protein
MAEKKGNQVLESTRFLIESPKNVFINKEKLEELAKRLANEELRIPDWNMPTLLEGKSKEVIDFFFLGNTINFAYVNFETKEKFSVDYQGKTWIGAMAMWACLKKAYENEFPYLLEGDFLRDISVWEFEYIFKGSIRIPLFEERLAIFCEVGKVLCNHYEGHFYNLVEQSDHRLFNNGNGLVERLTKGFPSFDDSVVYEGKLARFDKRAQLAPAMLYGRFRNQGEFVVQDINKLTVFADYSVPKTLRGLEILVYEKSLAEKVDNQVLIPKHSLEELEIRASTIHASQMLIDKINEIKGQKAVNALHIDYKLWWESRNFSAPHHLTRTIDY